MTRDGRDGAEGRGREFRMRWRSTESLDVLAAHVDRRVQAIRGGGREAIEIHVFLCHNNRDIGSVPRGRLEAVIFNVVGSYIHDGG